MKASLEGILDEIAQGSRRLTDDEALICVTEAPLSLLFWKADIVRRRLHGTRTTFIIDRNINYTNICEMRCAFCAFSRDEGDADAYVLTHDEVLERVREAADLGATQVMIQGGLYRKTGLSYVTELFRKLKTEFPHITNHSLSAAEIDYFARTEGLSLEETVRVLKEAGLDSLPGAGAEILNDEVRAVISPKKIGTQRWLDVHRAVHEAGLFSTATMVIGHVEAPKHRVAHLKALRDLQDETGGFRSFIPWIYLPGKTELGGTKATAAEYLRTIAVARLYLDNVPHVQASWLTVGRKVGQLALHAGADDLGSLMLEENVVRATGHDFVALRTDEMVSLIESAGFTAAQRRTDFSIVTEYAPRTPA
jgi:cyclic dehypoxanthinyl futalosine synthase